MVEVTVRYEGGLHCQAVHGPSRNALPTDAPADNMGRGESFSPTDLTATSLVTCMVTTMAIMAQRQGIELAGTTARVEKHMTSEPPRRIARLVVEVNVPLPADHPERAALERAGDRCPVRLSLHPEVEVDATYHWVTSTP